MDKADLIRVQCSDLSASANLNAGDLIDKKYQVLGLLGAGGMGAVYRVKHLGLDKVVALKTFISSNFSREAWQRFEREARAIARLNHENIIKVLDFGIADNNLPYYTMELVQGESLAQRLRRTGPLRLPELLYVFARLADALEHTHKKEILHRDLKPGNVYLELKDGRIQNLKLADFGIAALAKQDKEEQDLTARGTIFGSPLYMSPEQSRGEALDQRSDIYALGCVLFECAMGFPPYHGNSALATIIMHQTATIPAMERADLPKWLHTLYLSMMQKERENRLRDLSEVMDILAFNLPAGAGEKPIGRQRNDRESKDQDSQAEAGNIAPSMVAPAVLLSLATLTALFFIPAPHKPEHRTLLKEATEPTLIKSAKEPLISWHEIPQKPGKILIKFPQASIGKISNSKGLKLEAAGPVEINSKDPVILKFTGLYPESAEDLALLPGACFNNLGQAKNLGSTWDDRYFQVLSRFKNLRHLEVYDSDCTPRAITYLNELPELEALRLRSPNLNELDILRLKNLRRFWQLSLSGFQVSPRLIRALGQDQISVIDLRECRLEPGVIEALCKLKNLRFLELQGTSVSLSDLEKMQAKMTELQQIKLLRTGLTEEAVPILLRFKKLQRVEVPDDWGDQAVRQLEAKLIVLNK